MVAFRLPLPALIRREPFSFLLYLEWLLLGVALVSDIWPPLLPVERAFPWLKVAIVAVYGAMGLRLPTRGITKGLYIAVSFALILLALAAEGGQRTLIPFLLLLLVIRGCLILPLAGRITVAALAYAFCVLSTYWRVQDVAFFVRPLPPGLPPGRLFGAAGALAGAPPPPSGAMPENIQAVVLHLTLSAALAFGTALLFVLLLVNAMLAEYANRQKLALANRQLRAYAQRIEDQATLQERNRIARDIHDSLGHSLTALNMQMEMALAWMPLAPQRAQGYLADAKRLGTASLQAVRQSVSALRSDPLHNRSLAQSLGELAGTFEQTTGIALDCRVALDAEPTPEVGAAIFRIVQEGLTNICKHSGAKAVLLEVFSRSDGVHLLLADDGSGFAPEENPSGFGLEGMRERALALGADLAIESTPGRGCHIRARFPLPELCL
ncbi:sensor histidine kinase [Gloeobacter morelensis]|uniref:histidine kinase n=1 Tax=Gloeobacter morelensis MG652769 TaxID=2781736 RepID=A0ABY3PRF5_9CYAN|nr:sensor histidine kinase [Gloeobacter morelensis]UFP96219.1 sensor histidine kinase [Gloeobacter morelensis MG652769]